VRSSFLGDPGAIFFLENSGFGQRKKKEQKKKEPRPEGTSRMENPQSTGTGPRPESKRCGNLAGKASDAPQPEINNLRQVSTQVFSQRLEESAMTIRGEGRGPAMDTILGERWWRSAKYEELNLGRYCNPSIHNYACADQAMSYQTPAALYSGKWKQQPEET
jgi:hypothetical protein